MSTCVSFVKKTSAYVIAAVLIVILPLLSCQVGLGSSVDTEAPTVSVKYPPANAVIRDKFTIAGTCSDDKALASVTVTLTNTDTETLFGEYNAIVSSSKNSWTLSLNYHVTDGTGYNGWQFPDGQYKADVYSTDDAGRKSGITSLSFKIDNTAPLFIMKSPGSSDITNPTAYGTIFKLNGSISEDNNVSTMAVTILDSLDNPVASTDTSPYIESNIVIDGGITLAQYSSSSPASDLSKRYTAIYGTDISAKQTRSYYCKVKLTDGAKLYQNSSEKNNSTTGNTTDIFYFSDAISSLTSEYSAKDLKNIINGTVSDINHDSIVSKLAASASTKAAFSLNPDKSPKYNISSLKFTGNGLSTNEAVAQQKIVVTTSAGLNDDYIQPSTLKVYQFGPYTAAEYGALSISDLYNDPDYYYNHTSDHKQILTNSDPIYEQARASANSAETYNYQVSLSSSIQSQYYYLIAVSGTDKVNESIVPDGGYFGFIGKVTSDPPTLTIGSENAADYTNIANLGIVSSSDLRFSGSALSSSVKIHSVSYSVAVTNESDSTAVPGSPFTGKAAPADGLFDSASENWNCNISEVPGFITTPENKEYLYTITFTVQDTNNNSSSTVSRIIHVDKIHPAASLTAAPTVNGCIYGKVSVTSTASDTNMKTLELTAQDTGSHTSPESIFTSSSYPVTTTLDTSLYNGTLMLTLTAVDKAGNKGTSSVSYTIDKMPPSITLPAAQTAWLTSSTQTLSVSANDTGTGVSKVTYKIGTSGTENTMAVSNASASTYTTTLSLLDGTNDVYIYAADVAGNKTTVEYKYTYNIDTASPVLSGLSEKDSNGAVLSNVTSSVIENGVYVTGAFSDSTSGTKKAWISASAKKGGSVLSDTSELYNPNPALTDIWTIGGKSLKIPASAFKNGTDYADGNYTFYLHAADSAGNEYVSDPVTITIDTTKPSLSITNLSDDTFYTESSVTGISQSASPRTAIYTVSGTWSDETSGTSVLEYSTDNGTNWVTVSGTTAASRVTLNWTAPVTVTESSGNMISFRATDAYGNISDIVSRKRITFDFSVPVWNASPVIASPTSKDVSFTETVTDKLAINSSGITVTAKLNGADAPSNLYAVDTSGGTQTAVPVKISVKADSDTHTTDGVWIFTIAAKDAAGRAAETSVSRTFTLDTTPPSWVDNDAHPFTIGGIRYNSDKNWYKDTSLSFTGYFSESVSGSGITTVYYWINPDGTAVKTGDPALKSGSFSPSTSNGDACRFNAVISGFTTNSADNSIYFAAADTAGNISSASLLGALKVRIDATEPVITVDDAYKDTVLTKAAAVTATGTVSDSASGIDTDSITVPNGKGTISYTDKANNRYTLTLTAEQVSALGTGTNTINATVRDKAGNSYTGTILTLQVDTTNPVVTFTAPADNATVNKTITLTGTASDTQGFDYAELWYYDTSSSQYVQLTRDSANTSSMTADNRLAVSNNIWSYIIDTTKYYNETASSALKIKIEGHDKAGNTSAEERTVTIDQNTDRPTVKVTSIAQNGSALMYGDNASISGTVSDDDASGSAAVDSFAVTSSALTEAPVKIAGTGTAVGFTVLKNGTVTTLPITVANGSYYSAVEHGTSGAYDITIFDPASGDFTFIPYDITDGTKNMYFFVKDTKQTVFYTTNVSRLSRPYIKYKSGTVADNNAVVTYTSDSTAPAITAVGGSYGPTDAAGTDITSLTTNNTLGGSVSKFIKFKITASDANGIAGIALKVSAAGKTDTYLYNKATSGTLGSVTGLTPDSSGSFTANKTSNENTWTTGAIQLAGTGLITVTATVYDQSGLFSNSTSMFYADNDSPKVEIKAPGTETADWVTSTTTITGTVSDEGTAKVSSIEWMIPTKDQQTAYTSGTVPSTGWKTLTSTSAVSIAFDSTVKDDPANILTYANSTYAAETGTDTNVWHVPYYIRASDTVGNSKIDSSHYVVVDVDGGRPKAKILYPETNGTVGGTFTVYGTATDDLSVSYVKVQVDTNGDGQFNAADYTALTTASGGKNVWGLSAGSIVAGDGISTWYIKASGTNSWKLELNSASITTDSASIGIRVASVDGSDNTRPYLAAAGDSYVTVKIDQNIPKVSDLKVVQYSAVGSATSKERSYTTGMYVSNNIGTKQWYLSGTATDDGQIASISLTKANGSDFDITGTVTSATVSATPAKKTFYAALPSATDKSGIIYALLSVKDEQGHDFQQYITINLDNTAPSMYQTDGTEVTTTTSALRLKHASADINNSTNVVKNDNYLFTFGDTVKDANSGLSFLAFYFERAGSNKVLCPMYDNYTDTTSYITIDTAVTSGTASSGKTYINDDGLACMYASGSRGSTTTFTDKTNIKGSNIRKGGLIKIGGIYTKITNVDTSSGTVTFTDDVSISFTTAEIIFAQVVDHTGKESIDGTKPYIVDSTTDDGDSMIETLTPSGSSYDWSASIQSDYLTDGPVQIHAVAMDKAGNTSNGYVTTSVQNHCPRIARVLLGTDLNGNGKFDYKAVSGGTSSQQPVTSLTAADRTAEGTAFGEFSYYSAIASSGSYKSVQDAAQQIVTLGSGSFKVKNRLAILPEFVGGNTGLAYTFTADTTVGSTAGAVKTTQADGKAWTSTSGVKLNPMTAKTALSAQCADTGTGKIADQINAYGGISISTSDLASYESQTSSSSGARCFAFTFWDQTEGTTQGTDSQYALLILPVIVDVTDDTPPTAAIKPFYWNNAGDNSLYGNSSTNGHIELESDLPTATFSATSGLFDIDPKVSGKIRITGTAYDETRLRTINVDFAGLSITKYSSYNSTTLESQAATSAGYFAIYIPGSGWKISTPGTSAAAATVDTNGWSFTVTDPDGPTQAGHTVTWELDIDTGRLANIADTDKAVTVSANDASTANSNAGNTSAASTTQTTTASLKPYYRVDVVPYITGIKRNNSYNTYRTRSGGVALLRGETLNTITGFNLANLTNTTLSLSTDRAGTNVTTAAASFGTPTLSGSSLQFTVPDAARSGYLQLKVNSVAALNNVNGYKTYNTEDTTQLYDRTTLSDDRYVQIWRVNAADTFKSSSNAVYPAMAKATDGTLFASFSNYSSATVNYASFAKKTEVFYTYDPPEETDLCVTGSGTGGQVNVLYSANYQGGTASSWTSNSNDAGGLYCYDDSVDTIWVGRDNRRVLRFELFYHNQMLQQFKNFRVKRAGTAASDLIHVAYYDKITNSIHYSNTVENYSMDATTEFSWVNIDGGTDSDDSGTYSDGSSVSLTAARFTGTTRCTGTGDSVALALTSTKYPVIVYYDASNGVLKLARASATNPKGNVSKWTVQDVLGTSDPNYGTQVSYISAEIDSSGYLHIAFQNMKNQLVYIKSTNAPTNGTTAYTFGTSQTIDDSGTYIDLALNGTTPYISYLGRINSYDGMKIAYYDSSLDFNNDGTAEGGWETMTAPLNQKVTNVRSCIETQAKAADSNTYAAAIGFYPGADYRAAFFVGK